MSDTQFKVLIVGGGIGGLCLAQGLRKAGIPFALFERDRTRSERLQGFRIQINPDGDRALRACLPDALYDAYVATSGKASSGLFFATERLHELLSVPISYGTERAGGTYRSVSRVTLRQLLLEGLDDSIHFDKRFVRYEQHPNGTVTAYFEDGTSATGDLLVGVDGVNSRVRKQFLPDADCIDTGVLGIAAKIVLSEPIKQLLDARCLSGSTLVLGKKGRSMWIARQEFNNSPQTILGSDTASPPGLLFDNTADYAFWGFFARRESYSAQLPAQEDGKALRATVLDMIADWHPRIQRLVRESDPSTITLWAMRRAAFPAPWETTTITLMGDAIHSMPPTGGIGGNTALRDAHVFSTQLLGAKRNETTLLGATNAYEREMFEYGFAAVRSSLQLLESTTSDNALRHAMAKLFFRTVNHFPKLKQRVFMRS